MLECARPMEGPTRAYLFPTARMPANVRAL